MTTRGIPSSRGISHDLIRSQVHKTPKLGFLGKAVMFPFAALFPVALLLLSPLWGLLSGFLHGAHAGWAYVVVKKDIDFVSAPVANMEAAFRRLATCAMAPLDEEGQEVSLDFVP